MNPKYNGRGRVFSTSAIPPQPMHQLNLFAPAGKHSPLSFPVVDPSLACLVLVEADSTGVSRHELYFHK